MILRVTSPRALEFACYSAACAPPPAGTGGSVGGKGKAQKGRAASGGGAKKAAAAPKAAAPKAAAGGEPKGKIQSVENSKKVTGSGGKAALVQTTKYKDGSTEVHVERTNSKYYGQSTTVTIKSGGKTLAKVFNDDDPPPSKAAVGRMLKEAKEYEKLMGSKSGIKDVAGNLVNEGGWQDYGP